MLSKSQITKQSEQAYSQWCKQWREHAQENSKHKMHSLSDFENTGIGRAVLCAATGASLEREIETIKKYQHNVDIVCCDKSLGPLLDHGITPTFCVVCDANVSYEKYLKQWENQLENTILIQNVCANPKWADKGNWKKKYFFVVKDVLQSEHEFVKLSQCPNVVAAGTNVSNSLVIILTQSDNAARRNLFGYDKILLIGFDYSWLVDQNYYAFDKDGGGKANYMRHGVVYTLNGQAAFTSSNLLFSAKWLQQYIIGFGLPVVQCSRDSLLAGLKQGKLSEQMQYSLHPEDGPAIKEKVRLRATLNKQIKQIDDFLADKALQHHYGFIGSVDS